MIDPDIYVHCDAVQLQQVLMNMMNNARDAVEQSAEKQIGVRLERCRPDTEFFRRHEGLKIGDYACLNISDSGHGMDAETVERVFDPFFTTKEVGKGTGLGLSTAFHGPSRRDRGGEHARRDVPDLSACCGGCRCCRFRP
jgi:signal transduction histidine kinase